MFFIRGSPSLQNEIVILTEPFLQSCIYLLFYYYSSFFFFFFFPPAIIVASGVVDLVDRSMPCFRDTRIQHYQESSVFPRVYEGSHLSIKKKKEQNREIASVPETKLKSSYTALLTPNVMNIVQSSNLWEKSRKSFIIVLSKIDSSCPIVSPFNHCTRFECVTPDFVDITRLSEKNLRPVTECKKILKMTWSYYFSLFLNELEIVLKI